MAEVKTDCFAYEPKGRGKCRALRWLYCKEEECKFYKPKGTECDSCNKSRFHICADCRGSKKL